ncbi:tetratricopeptide repeat protein [Taibaiella koreensis]|uniref:tetratricopeptide repeat protein n=1 Tax=Taibaiella koreensis TaxID=1268548 RepID=UPI0019699E3F|nr:tetratricopeptide repeat protein [Taibaiella koreensis]
MSEAPVSARQPGSLAIQIRGVLSKHFFTFALITMFSLNATSLVRRRASILFHQHKESYSAGLCARILILARQEPSRAFYTCSKIIEKKAPLLLLVICLLFCKTVIARSNPSDSLSRLEDDALIGYSFRLFSDELQYADSATALARLDGMMQIAEARKSCPLRTTVIFLKGKYRFLLDANNKFRSITCLPFFDEVLAQPKCSDILYIEAMFFKGYTLSKTPAYSKGFEYIIRAKEMAAEKGLAAFPNTFELYAMLGNTFYSFSDYENALAFLLEGIKFQRTVEMREVVDAYNTIALCYRQMGNYDSAGYYFQYAFKLADKAHVADWTGIVSGNIGELLFRKKQYREALPYLYRDVQISEATQQIASAARASIDIAKIYLALSEKDSADKILQDAAPLVFAANENKVYAGYYFNLFEINKGRDATKAIRFVDSFLYYQEKAAKEMDIVAADRVKSKLEAEKLQANIKLLESESRRHRTERKGVIIIVVLMALAGWQLVRRVQAEKTHTKRQLGNARQLLDTYISTLKQKSKLLEETKHELALLNQTSGYDQQQNDEILHKLQQATILTEDDWRDFKKTFGQIHTQFFAHLEQHFPGLTNAEIRLLALSKIGLSINEKASALGISPDSVRKTKLRLFKKLGITEEEIFKRMDSR